jgi:hypothetical protein
MPPEVYNPNPTIYSLQKSSVRDLASKRPLWIDEEDELGETDEVEPIDRDEIFGGLYIGDPRATADIHTCSLFRSHSVY